jgi:hypothetical protein
MFTPQQHSSAKNIYEAFQSGIHYATLIAPCQSGKTGTFHRLFQLCKQNKLVQRGLLLCGSQERALYTQACNECTSYSTEGLHVMFFGEMARSVKIGESIDVSSMLIIIDESHMVQCKGQTVDQFLVNCCGIEMGRPIDCFMLSVDATPYAEVASYVHDKTPEPKHFEMLTPGPSYFGITKFISEKKIFPSMALNNHAVTMLNDRYAKRYGLFRFPTPNTKSEAELRRSCTELHIPVFEFTSESYQLACNRKSKKRKRTEHMAMDEANKVSVNSPCIANEPDRFTVVILRGMFRAGYSIKKKEYIGFAFDAMEDTKTDVAVQGLLGRLCGYYAPGAKIPDMYVPSTLLSTDLHCSVSASEIERASSALDTSSITVLPMIPTHAMNIEPCLKLRKSNLQQLRSQTPYTMKLTENEKMSINPTRIALKHNAFTTKYKRVMKARMRMMHASLTITDKQRIELEQLAKSTDVVYRECDVIDTTQVLVHCLHRPEDLGIVRTLKQKTYREPNQVYMNVYFPMTSRRDADGIVTVSEIYIIVRFKNPDPDTNAHEHSSVYAIIPPSTKDCLFQQHNSD